MNIAVLSLADDQMKPFRDLTFPNKAAWCAKHGYRWYPRDIVIMGRPPSWSKITMMLRLIANWDHNLEQRLCDNPYDWCFWTDADSLIMRMDWKVESILSDDADLVIAKDENGINCGVFAIRVCQASLDFLNAVWAQTDLINHRWWEQSAFVRLIDSGWPLRVKYASKQVINSYPSDYNPEISCILHTPGNSRWPDRIGTLRRYSAMVR